MNLKKKVLMLFLVFVLLPILLLTSSMFLLNFYQTRTIKRLYNINGNVSLLNLSSARLFESLINKLDVEFQNVETEDPRLLSDEKYLEGRNAILASSGSYLLMYRDDILIFNGGEDNETLRRYVESHRGSLAEGPGFLSSNETQYLIGSRSFSGTEESLCTAYLITNISLLMPRTENFLYAIVIITILVLMITASIVVSWIQNNLVSPIQNLQLATRAITDGNLDYALDLKTVGTQDEISRLSEDFEEMRKRLKQNVEERLQSEQDNKILISNISHDLKTPITAIKGYSEGILEGVAASPERLNKYVRTIYNKANDMDKLVDELTFYSKIDTNRIPYNFTRISVSSYFEDCVDELHTELDARGIELNYSNLLERDAVVIADTEQLKRVINNIISNSVKYMDKKQGIINIRLRDMNDFIRVEMEDNGKGIAMKDLPYIFDRFFRTDSSRNSKTGGSGIGLSIVRKIIEDHGGRIWATSREGFGTTMSFELRKYQEASI